MKKWPQLEIRICRNLYESTLTAAATAMVPTIEKRQVNLEPQECQVRRPEEIGASNWRHDNKTKILVCIATIEGGGTQYVSPEIAKEKFTGASADAMTVRLPG